MVSLNYLFVISIWGTIQNGHRSWQKWISVRFCENKYNDKIIFLDIYLNFY